MKEESANNVGIFAIATHNSVTRTAPRGVIKYSEHKKDHTKVTFTELADKTNTKMGKLSECSRGERAESVVEKSTKMNGGRSKPKTRPILAK